MQKLTEMEQSVLVDLLAEHTANLTRLLQERNRNEQYQREKQIIKMLATEIETRKLESRIATPPHSTF